MLFPLDDDDPRSPKPKLLGLLTVMPKALNEGEENDDENNSREGREGAEYNERCKDEKEAEEGREEDKVVAEAAPDKVDEDEDEDELDDPSAFKPAA